MKNVQRVQNFATDVNLYYVFSFSSKVLSVNFNTLNKGCKCGKDGSLMQKNIFPGIIIHTARLQRLASTKTCIKGNATNVYSNFITHNIQFDIHSYLQTIRVIR